MTPGQEVADPGTRGERKRNTRPTIRNAASAFQPNSYLPSLSRRDGYAVCRVGNGLRQVASRAAEARCRARSGRPCREWRPSLSVVNDARSVHEDVVNTFGLGEQAELPFRHVVT